MVKRSILLNPGPATTTDTVKYAQIVSDICPREKDFGDIMEFISRELTSFVGSNKEYASVLFGGSGTAAVESIISSVVDDDIIFCVIGCILGGLHNQLSAGKTFSKVVITITFKTLLDMQ